MEKIMTQKMLEDEIPLPRIARTLGAKVDKSMPDKSLLSMRYHLDERFTNTEGFIQGGILASMLDDAMSLALLSTMEPGFFAPSIELKVNFISPAFPGEFICLGKVISKGKRVCVLQGDLWQNNARVARASATALIQEKKAEMKTPEGQF